MGTPAGRKRKAATASASPAPIVQGTPARKRNKIAQTAAVGGSSNTEAPKEADNEHEHGRQENDGDDQVDNSYNKSNGEKDTPYEPLKTEPLSDLLGTDDMFGGEASDEPFLPFLPVT